MMQAGAASGGASTATPDPMPPAIPKSARAALERHPVLGSLDAEVRERIAERLVWRRFAAGELVADGDALCRQLGLVAEGRITLSEVGSGARVTLGVGAWFGAGVYSDAALPDWQARADTTAVVGFADAADLALLCAEHPALRLALHLPPAGSEGPSAGEGEAQLDLLNTPLRALIRRAPVTAGPEISVRDAAILMSERRVSSLPLVKDGHLFGLVTDRDLRNRALAVGLDPASPVIDIATVAPLTASVTAPAFEALLLMARHNVHHVPVMDGPRVAGMITATDVTEQHSTSAVYLAGEIHKQTTVDGLAAAAARVRDLQRRLAAAKASAHSTGQIVTAITDALTTRLLHLAEARLGQAPVDYAWVAAGSQARSEQTARSDQDNCLVLDDAYDEAAHGAYFEALAQFVNDGLNACGYVYCPGEMMARTAQWRQPRRRWAEYFRRWTEQPEPMALMLTCVFFDLRAVHGQATLLTELRRDMLRHTRGNSIFLAYMVGNALTHRPPLSLFGGISTVRHGERRDTVDLKHSGIVPIVDLARIYALAGAHEAVNTQERLAVAAQGGEISEQSARDLRDAFEFMGSLRLQHQARQIARNEPVDNMLPLGELSNFERDQLKRAFGVVQTLQSVLAQRWR
jgi:CBS domain-containing protein